MKFWFIMFLFAIGVIVSQLTYQYGQIVFLAGYLLGLWAGVTGAAKRQDGEQ